MAIEVKLIVDDIVDSDGKPEERDVTAYTYQFNKYTDSDGEVAGAARGGKITITVKSWNESEFKLLDWLINKTAGLKGHLEIKEIEGKTRTIYFVGAHCVEYIEEWAIKDEVHTEKITISCKKITFIKGDPKDTLAYEKDWE